MNSRPGVVTHIERSAMESADVERYRAVPFECYSIGFNQELVRSLLDERVATISTKARVRLDLCRNFKSLDEHNLQIRNALRLPAEETEQINGTFRDLLNLGFLMPERQLFDARNRSIAPVVPAVTSLVIVTANRPQSCGRTLNSFMKNVFEFDRTRNFVIMDDSRTDTTREHLRQLAGHMTRQYSLSYAGLIEKEAYTAALIKTGIDPQVARFALRGKMDDELTTQGLPTIGANRNHALLDTIGERIVTTDDYVLCRVTAHPNKSTHIRICSHLYPRDVWTFATREDVENLPWCTRDVIGDHERLLGANIADVISDANRTNAVVLEDTCSHIVQGIVSGNAVAVATMAGIAGDSGGNSAKWMLTCFGQIREDLLISRTVYDLALTSREILSVAPAPTITHLPFCQTSNIGLDNLNTLPPFFPIARGEDTIFGMLVMWCFPEACFAHLPYALFHDSERGRGYDSKRQLRVAEIISFLIASFQVPPKADRKKALKLVGRYLEELGNSSEAEFWESVSRIVRTQQAQWMRGWQIAMSSSQEYPDYWQQDVKTMHAESAQMLADTLNFIPAELRQLYPIDVAQAKTQQIVRMAGRLLCAWPDILEAALYLKHRGVRVSAPLVDRSQITVPYHPVAIGLSVGEPQTVSNVEAVKLDTQSST